MRNELNLIREQLAQTSRIKFTFKKTKIVSDVTTQLANVEENLTAIESKLSATEQNLSDTQTKLANTEKDLSSTKSTLASKEQTLASTEKTLSDTQTKLLNTEKDLSSTKSTLASKEQTLASTEKTLSDTQMTLASTQELLAEIESQWDQTKLALVESNQKLSNTKDKLDFTATVLADKESALNQKTAEVNGLKTQLDTEVLQKTIISNLLNAYSEHRGVIEFNRVLNEEFLGFANEESTLVNEAEALLMLQEVAKELKVIGAYPDFHNKNTIAVAGGFSAGKSEFISSLFSDKTMKLPSGVVPTTAIPVYAMNGTKDSLLGCSYLGGVVDLFKIDPNLQQKLSHNFISDFGFNLKSIMPYMFLTTKMPYSHLCFVDTPGYNPSVNGSSYTHEDFETAGDFVSNADALIWVISIGAGTIPKSDLEFLQEFAEEQSIYIVLNKADLRASSDIEDILDSVEEMLEDYDIEYEGISAYSSLRAKEMTFRKCKLDDFLKMHDHKSDYHQSIIEEIRQVQIMYDESLSDAIEANKHNLFKLEEIRKDVAKSKVGNFTQLEKYVMQLKADFAVEEYEKHRMELEIVMRKLYAAADMVFGAISKY